MSAAHPIHAAIVATILAASALATGVAAAPGSSTVEPGAVATDGAPPLGRVFFSAERRMTLDRLRALNIKETQQQIEDPTITVSGVVKRSGGPETAWINGQPQTDRAPGAIWSGNRSDPARISVLPPGESARQVRVGETLHRGSGEISSPLHGGTVGVSSGRKPDSPRP